MADIDAAVKTYSLENIDRAITYLGLAGSANKETNELSKLIQKAPERQKKQQDENHKKPGRAYRTQKGA